MTRGGLLRGVPLAALVACTAAAIAMRLSSPRAPLPHTTSAGVEAGSVDCASPARWPAPTNESLASSTPFTPDAATAGDAGSGSGAATAGARTFHGDARRTHRARGHGPKRVQTAWSVDVGGPVAAQVTTSPDGTALYVATLTGELVALTTSGEKKWRLSLGDRIYGAPSVADDGTIFVGSDGKFLEAVRPSGDVAFRLELDGEADSSPLLMPDGMIVVAAGDTVYGARARGDVAFRFRAKRKVYSAPTATSDGRIVFGSQDHRLYAITAAGALVFSVDLGADVDCAAAALGDGSVIVGTDGGEVVRIDQSGKVIWRTDVMGYVRGGVTLARNGDVLVGTFGPVPRVVRLSSSGVKLGALELQGTGARDFGIWGSPLEDDDGALYFGAEDDRVYGLDARGALLFAYQTRGDVDAPVTMLPDGSLIVGSEDGTVSKLVP